MRALVEAAKPKLASFNAQELANTAWALATLGHQDTAFMRALVEAAKPKLASFNAQALANTEWALAALNERDAQDFLIALLDRVGASDVQFSIRESCQLFQAMLWLDMQPASIPMPAHLYAACRSAWLAQVSDTTISAAHRAVFAAVQQLPGCSNASLEHVTDDGLFSIDVAVVLPGGDKLAVEVDGPFHFFTNRPTVLDGATRLRNRLLEARGWRVVSVRVGEWLQHAKRGEEAVHDYLMKSLGVRQ